MIILHYEEYSDDEMFVSVPFGLSSTFATLQ